jgi:glycosyltransferase involved in cell wall biosynthesis
MSGRIAILLATYEGARFLGEQLRSIAAQTHRDWVLYWRDDGSSDSTVAIMEEFAATQEVNRVVRVTAPEARLGATDSFMRLLAAATEAEPEAPVFAFADQDDVWQPNKLARAWTALADLPPATPALYCARQILVDAGLHRLGISPPIRAPGFPAALTQNIATGCTVVMNRAAARLVAGTRPPAASMHDWWAYILVAAAGGRILADDEPVVLYRQHRTNAIGAPASVPLRALAALKRGSRAFMRLFRQHVDALAARADILAPQPRAALDSIERALRGGILARAGVLRMPGLRRQTWYETLLFRCWFLLG